MVDAHARRATQPAMLKSRFLPFSALVILTAVGCGSAGTREGGAEESLALDENSSTTGVDEQAYKTPISFGTFDDDLDGAGQNEVRKVFTSASAYRNYFGHDAPSDVDFYYDWVVFYSAGTQSTAGYTAKIESVYTSGSTIYVKTRLESPGDNCNVTQAETTPYAFARFSKPYPRPKYVRYQKHDATLYCEDQTPTCDTMDCPSGTHCVDSSGPAHCVNDPCPGAGRRSPNTHQCECKVLGICALGMSWNEDPAVCGCE